MNLIRATEPSDINSLPAIERSAGAAFRQYPQWSWVADGELMSIAEHARLVGLEYCWVAEQTDRLCGFLAAEPVVEAATSSSGDSRVLHIWELAVEAEAQGAGIGRELMGRAIDVVNSDSSFDALTLTTFRDVVFNAPFYAQLGFEELEEGAEGEAKEGAKDSRLCLNDRLRKVLALEAAHGLPRESRCAMRYVCDAL